MKKEMRNVFFVARREYSKWLWNPRMAVALVLLIPIREMIIIPMQEASMEMGQPINLLEPGIAAANSGILLALIPLAYLVLASPFPTVDGNMAFYIARMGKRDWALGEIVFQAMAAATYCALLAAATMVQAAGFSFLANGWSIPATDYDKVAGMASGMGGTIDMAALLPPSLYFQMPPYKAFLLSYALLGLLLLLSSMALLFGSLCSWKLPTFCLVVGQMLLGFGLAEFHHPAMWLFPFSHAIVQFHYQDYLREYVFPPGASAAILGGAALAFAALCLWAADRADLDRIGGDIL